jgi:hypothetical protein
VQAVELTDELIDHVAELRGDVGELDAQAGRPVGAAGLASPRDHAVEHDLAGARDAERQRDRRAGGHVVEGLEEQPAARQVERVGDEERRRGAELDRHHVGRARVLAFGHRGQYRAGDPWRRAGAATFGGAIDGLPPRAPSW